MFKSIKSFLKQWPHVLSKIHFKPIIFGLCFTFFSCQQTVIPTDYNSIVNLHHFALLDGQKIALYFEGTLTKSKPLRTKLLSIIENGNMQTMPPESMDVDYFAGQKTLEKLWIPSSFESRTFLTYDSELTEATPHFSDLYNYPIKNEQGQSLPLSKTQLYILGDDKNKVLIQYTNTENTVLAIGQVIENTKNIHIEKNIDSVKKEDKFILLHIGDEIAYLKSGKQNLYKTYNRASGKTTNTNTKLPVPDLLNAPGFPASLDFLDKVDAPRQQFIYFDSKTQMILLSDFTGNILEKTDLKTLFRKAGIHCPEKSCLIQYDVRGLDPLISAE